MTKRISALAAMAAPAIALLIGGCADRSQFPSLARRPAEDAYQTASAVRPAPTPPAIMSEGLADRLSALVAKAAEGHATFESRLPSATRTISAAGAATKGSESWSVASVALAGLEAARSLVALPLADLDRLEAEASNRAVDGSDADLKAVRAARAEVEGLVQAETQRIDGLKAKLGA
ncbi:hypothetical protein HGI47_09555 [Novosphingobium sp. ERN07]|uniref:hypothetical protein n=1 Tax=Novosphingobium sp. ERN07 TaxID=2726187 RepID=UPI0014565AE2|nr:hypothetical protein [Novosphingobium sp. ERN07]NLR71118.1 hypothetical protein [Novosphingobium sp. ERN07]